MSEEKVRLMVNMSSNHSNSGKVGYIKWTKIGAVTFNRGHFETVIKLDDVNLWKGLFDDSFVVKIMPVEEVLVKEKIEEKIEEKVEELNEIKVGVEAISNIVGIGIEEQPEEQPEEQLEEKEDVVNGNE